MDENTLKNWKVLIPSLSEAQKRWYVGLKAIELGRGGIARMHELTGLSENTIIRGMREVKRGKPEKMGDRVRDRGAGRRPIEKTEPTASAAIQEIVDESTAGNPVSPIKWTRKSCRTIEEELKRKKIEVSYRTVCRLLHESGYTLQSNRKDKEGKSHPDRDQQFRFIADQASSFLDSGRPVISVDTKKKERVGDFKNAGETWRRKGSAEKVNVYDFPNLAIGTAVPYGAYDVARNEGFVNVGTSHDTAEFAVESIRQWWKLIGKKHYSKSKELLICADGGGSNSSASRR
jgi:transposase